MLDDADKRQQSFLDAISRLEEQAIQQRIEALQSRRTSELDEAEKHEMRELLSLRASRARAIPRG
ncbi:DNA primase DnaG DnaB-binding protein [compost metagenome]